MRPDRLRFGSIWPDRFLLAFLVLNFGVYLYLTTFTDVLRQRVFLAFLDIFLPYYVASRSLKDMQSFRDALMSFVVVALVLSAFAIFETVRHWSLYNALPAALGVSWGGMGGYISREVGGLRAQVSTGHPIALGFVLCVALGLALFVRASVPSLWMRRLGLALLAGGLLAALSRGPWVAAVAMLLAFAATGPGAGRKLAKYTVIALVAVPLLRMLPGVGALIELLPFVGSIETGNIDYRQRLLDVALDVIWESPWFGGVDIYSVEGNAALQQYHGFIFIDVVNTYVGILLGSGFVGLFLFLGFFAAIGLALRRAMAQAGEGDDERRLLGRALFATLIGILVTIATASSISVIPTVYWCVAGVAVAYSRMILAQAPLAAFGRRRSDVPSGSIGWRDGGHLGNR
jgi:O-antigen ligase